MSFDRRMLAAGAAALLLAGCGIGAREVDYTPQRAYSSDISASLDHGPTASQPGMVPTGEPIGALPWDIGESRQ